MQMAWERGSASFNLTLSEDFRWRPVAPTRRCNDFESSMAVKV